MYIPNIEGLDFTTTLPAVQLSKYLLQKAVRLNHCYSEWLGWYRYRRRIERFLGLKKRPTPIEFALAVAAWQDNQDLIKDGIIGLNTFNSILFHLGKEPLRQEPNRPDWISWVESPNHSSRKGQTIDTLIYHATGGQQIKNALNTFKGGGTSAHYVIARDGQIIQMVELDRAAQHAGSKFNRRSIGIEIVNVGPKLNKGKTVNMCDRQGKGRNIKRCLSWKDTKPELAKPSYYRYSEGSWLSRNEYWVPYTERQYRSLIRLTNFLVTCIPSIKRITGHEHLLPWKKKTKQNGKIFFTKNRNDPGGSFDWERISSSLPSWFNGKVCHEHGKHIKNSKKISNEWRQCFHL